MSLRDQVCIRFLC